jgi:TRAP-type C4-dicarboxylate transport system substrate-binding protein
MKMTVAASLTRIPLAGIVAAGILGTVAVPSLVATPAVSAEIKLAHFMSPRHPMDRFLMRPWTEQIAKATNNALTVRIYPGGALGKGPVAQFKRAVDGIADVTFGLPGFTSKIFPRTGVIELPGVAKDAVAAANQLWDAFPLLAPEWRRVEVLALWTNERQTLLTKKKAVRSIADLKDMKIRVPSKTQGITLKALGAVPVFMPINRVYNALNTGVIDGVMTGPSTIGSFKFDEVAKYFTTGMPLGRSPFFLVMNRDTWKKQSDAHKDIIRKTTGRAMSIKGSAFYIKAGKRGLAKVSKSDKHEVIVMKGAALAEATAALMKSRADQIAALEKRGVPAKKILAAMGVK